MVSRWKVIFQASCRLVPYPVRCPVPANPCQGIAMPCIYKHTVRTSKIIEQNERTMSLPGALVGVSKSNKKCVLRMAEHIYVSADDYILMPIIWSIWSSLLLLLALLQTKQSCWYLSRWTAINRDGQRNRELHVQILITV